MTLGVVVVLVIAQPPQGGIVQVAAANEVQEALRQAGAGADIVRVATGQYGAIVDDGDVGAQPLHEFHDVGGEHDGAARCDVGRQDLADDLGGDGVDGFEGFVEDEEGWAVDEGLGEEDFFGHAGGVVGNEAVAGVGEVEDGEEFFGALVDGGWVHAA